MKDPLLALVDRRHPLYYDRIDHWNFIEATVEGGRSWFAGNIFRYLKEGDKEYADRVSRAYRFNHTKQVIELVGKYLFKMPIGRRDDAPAEIKTFWGNATLNGLPIDELSKRIGEATSKFGRVWVVVDSTQTDFEVRSQADAIDAGLRSYAYIITPQDMLDMSYDEKGNLRWALVREVARDDVDPLASSGGFINRFRLWERDTWTLYEERVVKGKRRIVEIDFGMHGLGVVPMVQADHEFSEEAYVACGLVDDIAYLDRANANYLSCLDAIIQDQTFSQLVMPAQGVMPGEDGYEKLLEAGTKRIFTFNAEGGGAPAYISPDPKQATIILTTLSRLVSEMYASVGLGAQRTKDDSGTGQDNASGVAKAYDFERINTVLASKAASMEMTEVKILRLVQLWAGVTPADDIAKNVVYPRNFDVRGLYDEFEISARLSLLAAPDEIRREQMRAVIKKLFPALDDVAAKKFEDALASWPPPPLPDGTDPNAKNPLTAASTQKVAKELAA